MIATTSDDLFITDNNMPVFAGLDMIKQLRSARMTLPVILTSDSAPANTKPLRLAALLPKSFFALSSGVAGAQAEEGINLTKLDEDSFKLLLPDTVEIFFGN